jgi:CubicO group peptidase (beta-lactamase class C family)
MKCVQHHPQAGKDGIPEDRLILGPNMLGHGAASSTILRVDPDNDLVIVVARNHDGKDYVKYLHKFFLTIEDGLAK